MFSYVQELHTSFKKHWIWQKEYEGALGIGLSEHGTKHSSTYISIHDSEHE